MVTCQQFGKLLIYLLSYVPCIYLLLLAQSKRVSSEKSVAW